jgi:hypothetical protein
MIHVTNLAAELFVERARPDLSLDGAKAEIRTHERAILVAARFGCSQLKLGCGARLVIDASDPAGRVITVLPKRARRQ